MYVHIQGINAVQMAGLVSWINILGICQNWHKVDQGCAQTVCRLSFNMDKYIISFWLATETYRVGLIKKI